MICFKKSYLKKSLSSPYEKAPPYPRNPTNKVTPIPVPFIRLAGQLTLEIQEHVITIDPMKGMITSYIASPQGQEMVREYLASPEGQRVICEFVNTPKGRQTMKQVLPSILSCMSLPPDLQSEVARTLKEIP
jgi:hypothetical protein